MGTNVQYCMFRIVIQYIQTNTTTVYIQQTEQLYRQLVVPNTADRGSVVQNVPAMNARGVPLLLEGIYISWFYLTLSHAGLRIDVSICLPNPQSCKNEEYFSIFLSNPQSCRKED